MSQDQYPQATRIDADMIVLSMDRLLAILITKELVYSSIRCRQKQEQRQDNDRQTYRHIDRYRQVRWNNSERERKSFTMIICRHTILMYTLAYAYM